MATNQQIISWAEKIWGKWGEKLSEMLGIDLVTPIFRVKQLGDSNAAETDAQNKIIYLDPDHFGSNRDIGAIIHEGTHLFQNLVGGSVPPKAVEAIADAARMRAGVDEGTGWTPSRLATRFASLNDAKFKQVVQSMQSGQYSPQTLKAIETGNVAQYNVSEGISQYTGVGTPLITGLGTGGVPTGTKLPPPPSDTGSGYNAAETRAAMVNWFTEYGIPLNDHLRGLIDRGVENQWGTQKFLKITRQTPEYAARFPGIFDNKGTLKMTESQYFSTEESYLNIAAQEGIDLSDRRVGWLFRRDVSPAEFQTKAEAFVALRDNKDLFRQFAQEIKIRGLSKGEVTKKELFNFIMGRGNAAWHDLWDTTVARNAAVEAGIKIAKGSGLYTGLSRATIMRLADKGFSAEALQQGFTTLADKMLDVLPMTEAKRYGLTKGDLVQATFGGKGSTKARQKLEFVEKTYEAFYEEQRASSQVTSSQEGGLQVIGGKDQQAQT